MDKKISVILLITLSLFIFSSIAFASDNEIYGDRVSIFKDTEVKADTDLMGDVISIFGDVEVNGNVDGDIVTIFGSIDINGEVDGSTITIFGNVDISEEGYISEDKVQIIGRNGVVSPDSQVGGGEVNILATKDFAFGNMITGFSGLVFILFILFFIKGLFGFIGSIIFVLILPEKMKKVTDATTERIPRRFGIGLLTMIIYWLFLTVGSAIIIGIPVIIILVPAVTILGIGGNTAIKLAIGRKVDGKKHWSLMTQLIVGSLIYFILELTIILKPILYLAKIVGIGAIVDTKFGTVEYFNENDYKNNYPPVNDDRDKIE